jgi:transposase
MNKVARFFIGVDLHKTVIQICVVDQQGEVVQERRHLAHDLIDGLKVVGSLMSYRDTGRVAVEAIGVNRWFVNALLERGFDVVVCDPVKLNLKMLGRKTDRKDAQEIARRLLLGDIDRNATTYYPSDQQYGKRKVIRTRHKLMQTRQEIINQIRALLNAYKITGFGESLLTAKAIRKLLFIRWPAPQLQAVIGALVRTMTSLSQAIEELDRQVKSLGREDLVQAVQEGLPSVGPVTASVLVHELGDVQRFQRSRAVASYAGLVPRVNQSADTAHHGRLTKRGNRELRHVLGEWAVRLMAHDPLVRQWARPRLRRRHKNKVRMELARRLLIGAYKLLRTGEVFSMERCLGM